MKEKQTVNEEPYTDTFLRELDKRLRRLEENIDKSPPKPPKKKRVVGKISPKKVRQKKANKKPVRSIIKLIREKFFGIKGKKQISSKEPSFKDLDRRFRTFEKNTDKRFELMKESLSMIEKILVEMKGENNRLKKDKTFLLEKIKKGILGQKSEEEEEDNHKNADKHQDKQHQNKGSGKKEATPKSDDGRGSGQNVETSLDMLLDIVLNKEKVNMLEASKTLHVSEKQIEEWARILESHELVEIHYPAIGKPVIKKKS